MSSVVSLSLSLYVSYAATNAPLANLQLNWLSHLEDYGHTVMEMVSLLFLWVVCFQAPAWDGNKLLYTASPLDIPGGRYEMEVDLARRDDREEEHGGKSKRIRKTYKVIINFSRVVSTDSLRQHLEGTSNTSVLPALSRRKWSVWFDPCLGMVINCGFTV